MTASAEAPRIPDGQVEHHELDLLHGGSTVINHPDRFASNGDPTGLAIKDLDFGTGGTLLLPSFPGTAHPNLAVELAKDGTMYVVDANHMGGLAQPLQSFTVSQLSLGRTDSAGLWGAMSYLNGVLYVHAADDNIKAFQIGLNQATNTMQFNPNPISVGSGPAVNFPGDSTTISSNNGNNAIVWDLNTENFTYGGPAVLRGYDASNLSHVLFDSSQDSGNQGPPAVKFAIPTVADGMVFVAGQGEVDVYGLRSLPLTRVTALRRRHR